LPLKMKFAQNRRKSFVHHDCCRERSTAACRQARPRHCSNDCSRAKGRGCFRVIVNKSSSVIVWTGDGNEGKVGQNRSGRLCDGCVLRLCLQHGVCYRNLSESGTAGIRPRLRIVHFPPLSSSE
jgi:hypothetical protein